jgi:hypothetical protein
MAPHRLVSVFRRTAAGAAILAATAAFPLTPAQAGGISTTNCLHGFGSSYDFRYNRSYNNSYGAGGGGYYGSPWGGNYGGTGSGYYGGNASGYGGVSGSGTSDGGCVEIHRELTNPYLIHIPAPQSEKDIADTATRERLWEARCKPVIRQDQYGVRRYRYAAPGCEYGKYE